MGVKTGKSPRPHTLTQWAKVLGPTEDTQGFLGMGWGTEAGGSEAGEKGTFVGLPTKTSS